MAVIEEGGNLQIICKPSTWEYFYFEDTTKLNVFKIKIATGERT